MLPTALPDSMERSNSTLSLVADQGTEKSNKRHSMIRETVQELQSQQMREQENLSLDQQAWYAGELNVKTASDRLDLLPVGKASRIISILLFWQLMHYEIIIKCP